MTDPIAIKATQLNANDDEVKLVELNVEDGAFVNQGDRVFTVETSKAAEEIVAPAAGYIALWHALDAMVRVGEDIATLFASAEAMGAARAERATQRETASRPEPRATRKAVELARKLNVDLAAIASDGIIREEDVRRHAEAQDQAAESGTKRDLSKIQRGMIKTLRISQTEIIPAYLFAQLPLKRNGNEAGELLDQIMHKAARLFAKYPDCNAYFDGERVCQASAIDFGFTVDVDGELYMPVVRGAEQKSAAEIAAARADMILSLYRGEINQEMLAEPTVCATGLTGRHLTYQIPIVYPKTSLILGVNQISPTSKTGEAYLSFAYDHRVLSGLAVSRFADELVDALVEGE